VISPGQRASGPGKFPSALPGVSSRRLHRLRDKASYLDFVLEVIQRHDGVKGFEVQPRPWVVERTFS
jgi:hypothetical protein